MTVRIKVNWDWLAGEFDFLKTDDIKYIETMPTTNTQDTWRDRSEQMNADLHARNLNRPAAERRNLGDRKWS